MFMFLVRCARLSWLQSALCSQLLVHTKLSYHIVCWWYFVLYLSRHCKPCDSALPKLQCIAELWRKCVDKKCVEYGVRLVHNQFFNSFFDHVIILVVPKYFMLQITSIAVDCFHCVVDDLPSVIFLPYNNTYIHTYIHTFIIEWQHKHAGFKKKT